MTSPVTFVPLDERMITTIETWFDDAEVRRRLGGRDWPRQALRSVRQPAGELFGGMRVLRSFAWVAHLGDEPVGYVGGDVYDRWITAATNEPGPAAGLAYLVDPARRNHGLGRRLLNRVLATPSLLEVRLIGLGIDVDNVASRRCAEAAGFAVETEPDEDGMVYHVHRRR